MAELMVGIGEKIEELKNSGKRIWTNCYAERLTERAEKAWSSPNALLFTYKDHGVNRLVYYAADFTDIAMLFGNLDSQEYMIEFMTREPEENRRLLEMQGFRVIARMMRLSNANCQNVFMGFNMAGIAHSGIPNFIHPDVLGNSDPEVGKMAMPGEEHEINQVLWDVFDTRISHLLSDEELKEAVERHEITIHRGKTGEIDAILQVVVQPRRFYINQIYNRGNREIIHAMLLTRLKEYCDFGGKYLYAWVEEHNIASVRFHQKYGMKHDGMWNMVYQLEQDSGRNK